MRRTIPICKPALRFKDEHGQEYPDWEKKKLMSIGKFIGGGTPNTKVRKYWNGNIPWITSADIHEGDIYNIKVRHYISAEAVQNSATNKIPANNVIFASRVGVGKVAKTKFELCISQDFTGLIVKTKDVASFLACQYLSKTNLLVRYSQGTSIKGYTSKDLKRMPVFLPVHQEQQKIASFLSSVDMKIEQLSQKKYLLERYKKGMMQQLFSRVIRFKTDDGKKYPNEFGKNLCDLAEVIRGVTFKRGDAVDVAQTGRLPVLRAGNIGDELNLHQDLIWLPANVISPAKLLRKQDIVMCASSGSSLLVGKSAIVRQKWKGTVGAFCFIIRVYSSECNSDYLAYFLKSSKFRRWTKIAEGTNIKNIRMGDLRSFLVPLRSCKEQQKIAGFLSSVDTKIEQVALQIDQAQKFKKGLLQQMFV